LSCEVEGDIYWNNAGTNLAVAYANKDYEPILTLFCIDKEIAKQYSKAKIEFQQFGWSSSGTMFAVRMNTNFTIYSSSCTQIARVNIETTKSIWRPNILRLSDK